MRRARAGQAPGIFFDPCPTDDLLGGALSAVRAQCNYLDGYPSYNPIVCDTMGISCV